MQCSILTRCYTYLIALIGYSTRICGYKHHNWSISPHSTHICLVWVCNTHTCKCVRKHLISRFVHKWPISFAVYGCHSRRVSCRVWWRIRVCTCGCITDYYYEFLLWQQIANVGRIGKNVCLYLLAKRKHNNFLSEYRIIMRLKCMCVSVLLMIMMIIMIIVGSLNTKLMKIV